MTTEAVLGRVGGLAAALGVGVVIGLAAAAPASADTADSAAQSSARHSAPTPRRTAPAVRADRVPQAAASTRPKSSVPAARPLQVRERRIAAAATPAPAAASPSVAPAASVDAPAAPAPAAALLGCDPRGQKITVFKGTHVALPLNLAFFTRKVTGSATFTPDTAYDLGDVDQFDWNKLTGIAFSPLQHDRNSAMVAWRYNLTSGEFEIAPFYNVDKKRILPNELTEVISVPADQSFTYAVDYTGITVSYGDKTVYKPYPEGLKPIQLLASRVSGWFGGNEVAPNKVTYYLKLKRL